ncbi:aryl-alcohol dehydrogenase-like predicted oxidoreductase [Stackebrandtia albiflava]|uniref:Aryl-alcohol dehydrogenase-like predicted oxidoreductase n=1 Tax=Stackebrandtia albiflava TaxID=406432 RepID=A0A562UL24_9ACTN|nr:aldo/keto reductase [Stackebrandtia albiflava]TWJ06315.1 aryl-alcohol dehydrogenase-like predicted oxidoreductase [Stackebrandtia albiflava]
MEQRPLGLSGFEVSRLGLGTMTWGVGSDFDVDDAAAQLTTFTEAGGTLVDTADIYGQGAAETVLGELLDKVVPRSEVHLSTKSGVVAREPRHRNTSRGHLLRALDASLQRLGTDHVDLWQLHVHDPDTPMEETLATLDHAVASGRARYVGLSNHTGWQTGRAVAWQRAWPGRVPITANQVEYSLVQRGIEREVLPACLAMDVGVLAWSPLGRGVLTGKYRYGRPSDSRASSPQWGRFVSSYLDDRCAGIVEAVATAADGLGVTPLEVALSWVRDQPGVTSAVVGARNAAQLRGALAAEAVFLPPEIRLALADVSAPELGYPENH